MEASSSRGNLPAKPSTTAAWLSKTSPHMPMLSTNNCWCVQFMNPSSTRSVHGLLDWMILSGGGLALWILSVARRYSFRDHAQERGAIRSARAHVQGKEFEVIQCNGQALWHPNRPKTVPQGQAEHTEFVSTHQRSARNSLLACLQRADVVHASHAPFSYCSKGSYTGQS